MFKKIIQRAREVRNRIGDLIKYDYDKAYDDCQDALLKAEMAHYDWRRGIEARIKQGNSSYSKWYREMLKVKEARQEIARETQRVKDLQEELIIL